MMLSTLDLARRIEAGELTPWDVVDLCAQAIAEREADVGAFAHLDLAAARQRAIDPALAKSPLRGLPIGSQGYF